MSKPPRPRALQELMTAVDAGVNVDSASSDSSKLQGPRPRSTYYGRGGGGGGGARKSTPPGAVAMVETSSSDASFEFSAAVVSYSSASPASMVFSDGQLRAHQFPAVRSSTGSSQATSPVRSSSVESSYSSTAGTKQQAAAGVTAGSKKSVSFATDGAGKAAAAGKAGGGQGKKSGGLLGCMASACGQSSRNDAVEPVARNHNRKVVAF